MVARILILARTEGAWDRAALSKIPNANDYASFTDTYADCGKDTITGLKLYAALYTLATEFGMPVATKAYGQNRRHQFVKAWCWHASGVSSGGRWSTPKYQGKSDDVRAKRTAAACEVARFVYETVSARDRGLRDVVIRSLLLAIDAEKKKDKNAPVMLGVDVITELAGQVPEIAADLGALELEDAKTKRGCGHATRALKGAGKARRFCPIVGCGWVGPTENLSGR